MRALILAGGKGTRLRPLTVYTPKPIVPMVNRPFLLYQIDILRRAGIRDITLSLNYQPDKIRQLLGFGKELGVNLNYVTEPHPMGTAGAYKYAADEFEETTVVLNGDILTDLIVSKCIKHHQKSGAEATIALTAVEDPSTFGLVKTDEQGSVLRFLEKPKGESIDTEAGNLINAGIYVLEPGILDLIPEDENRSFEYDVFPLILEKKLAFSSFVLENAYWRDIGTPENYLKAHMDFLAGKIRNFKQKAETSFEQATSTFVDDISVIGRDCVIKPNAKIVNSVLGKGVHVEEKAVIENSVVWPHTRVSNSARVIGAVVARSCYIGKNVVVSDGAILGNKASLTDYTKV